MSFLSTRGWLLSGMALVLSGGLVFACSSNDDNFTDGGGMDSSTDSTTDQGQPGKDAGKDVVPMTCEAGVSGSCDIVLQNCPSGHECTAVNLEAGVCTYQLQCTTNTTGSLAEGYACTQGASNPCVAGLECIEGRCARHCCLGDDSVCGTSQPEGFTGACAVNVSLQYCTGTAYSVCTYAKPCELYQLLPCGPGLDCVPQTGTNGNATCSDYASGTDAGKAEKATCQYSNDCEDGMGCYGALDGGASSCTWQCYVKGMGGPYDSMIAADAGAGKGGCPTGEACTPINWSGMLPAWLGLCEP
jgi:hypothetical protein